MLYYIKSNIRRCFGLKMLAALFFIIAMCISYGSFKTFNDRIRLLLNNKWTTYYDIDLILRKSHVQVSINMKYFSFKFDLGDSPAIVQKINDTLSEKIELFEFFPGFVHKEYKMINIKVYGVNKFLVAEGINYTGFKSGKEIVQKKLYVGTFTKEDFNAFRNGMSNWFNLDIILNLFKSSKEIQPHELNDGDNFLDAFIDCMVSEEEFLFEQITQDVVLAGKNRHTFSPYFLSLSRQKNLFKNGKIVDIITDIPIFFSVIQKTGTDHVTKGRFCNNSVFVQSSHNTSYQLCLPSCWIKLAKYLKQLESPLNLALWGNVPKERKSAILNCYKLVREKLFITIALNRYFFSLSVGSNIFSSEDIDEIEQISFEGLFKYSTLKNLNQMNVSLYKMVYDTSQHQSYIVNLVECDRMDVVMKKIEKVIIQYL